MKSLIIFDLYGTLVEANRRWRWARFLVRGARGILAFDGTETTRPVGMT
jgi:phosphoserine phosphatase